MASWLFGLKIYLVYISLFTAGASPETIKLGDFLLLPTEFLSANVASASNAEIQLDTLPESLKKTTFGPESAAPGDEVVTRDVEEITDKVDDVSTTPAEDEGINPDLGSSLDLVNDLEENGSNTDTADKDVTETAIDVETINVGVTSDGKTHLEVNFSEAQAEEIAEYKDSEDVRSHPVVKEALFVHHEKVFDGMTCSETVEQEAGDIVMDGAPDDSPCTGFAWTVDVGDGFSADVTLKTLNVSEVNGEFMIIGPGSSLENLWQDESNPLFTAVIKKERKFRILQSTTFTVFLITNSPEGFHGGFSLSYERAVMVETTPVPTTPAPTLPSPGANVTSVITVFLGGKTPNDFVKQLVLFQEDVASMANKYSEENGILLTEDATFENVLVTLVTQCDVTWRYSETCVRVNMSVAVITANSDNPDEFELTAAHLQDMWDSMAYTDSGLAAIGLYVYNPPNAEETMLLWLGISLGVLVIFVFILLAVWRMEIFRDYVRMTGQQNAYSGRDSTASTDSAWFPTSHQLVPPFMDVYSEVGYVEYEPEFNGPVPVSKYQTPTIVKPQPMYEAPPKYGPPSGFGGAVHFYGNTMRHFDNNAFVEDEENEGKEEEVNTAEIKYPKNGIMKKSHENDNSTC